MTDLILASASPRRYELLQQIGVNVDTCPVDLDESVLAGELPAVYVRRLAEQKAQAGFNKSGQLKPALGSDTAVVLNDQIMGKPTDVAHAKQMLQLLSGQTHQVLTSVAVTDDKQTLSVVVSTDVTFHPLSEDVIAEYWKTGEPADKAGGYGIQGKGAVFVSHISGSYSSVVGLPLSETAQLLQKFGIPIWQAN